MMRTSPAFLTLAALLLAPCGWAQGQTTAKATTPKIVLIGDSIRMGYAPLVAKALEGRAVVVSHPENGGDSRNVLANLDDWVIREKPNVVHINAGLHDLKRAKADGSHQVELDDYAENLRTIVDRIRNETNARVVFASTTPILDDRHARRGADFDRVEADVLRYNDAAATVLLPLNVPIHDLHWVVEQAGAETLLQADGTHYTPAGNERLAEAVVDCVSRHLAIAIYQPIRTQPSGPEAAKEYRKTQAARDALVPAAYKAMTAPEFHPPADADEWKSRRPEVLATVRKTLGTLPPRPSPPKVRVVTRESHPGFSVEKIALDNGVDSEVPALFITPERATEKLPAILWLHSSTPDKNQVLIPNTNGGEPSLAEEFTQAGYAILAPDAYWHGDRVGTGPSGAAETNKPEQESLHKIHLWFGRTLWGMFVHDDQVALDYLVTRPEVDAARIGTTGISMGSTRAWWLAAVDERIAATVGVACLTRYQNLIAHGELRAHGVYYFVDGLLNHFDVEGVLALIAPRPYLALTGDLDAGSPADGILELERITTAVYNALNAPDQFRSILYPDVGHFYTPEMRVEMRAWFDRWLQPTSTTSE